jgi:hypothetical protein
MKWKKPDESVHFNSLSACNFINIHHALAYSVWLQNTISLPSVSTLHLFFCLVLASLGPLANSPSDSSGSSADSGGARMDGSSSAEMKQTKQIIPE